MAFTDEDRNILIKTATQVKNIEDWIGDLPCRQHPPECTQEHRLSSLETSRDRGVKAGVSVVIGAVLTAIGVYIRYLFHTGG
jgi:hypothetical protein